MHAPSTILLTSLLAFFSTSISAAPACVVPQIVFETLDKPFTLTAIAPKSSWAVLLQTPSATVETQPYISHSRIAPPIFHLTKGKVTTIGANGQKFPAHFGPTIEIFPPVLQPIFFGGDSAAEPGFFAGYACDNETGKTYLQLRGPEPLVVEKVAEGQKIFGQPSAFQGTDVTLSFQINEQ